MSILLCLHMFCIRYYDIMVQTSILEKYCKELNAKASKAMQYGSWSKWAWNQPFLVRISKRILFHRWRDVSWKGLNLLVMELVPLCPALPLSILWQCSKPSNQDDDGAHEDMYIYYDDTWYMIHDTWYMIHDTWKMIHDTWYMIHNTYEDTNIHYGEVNVCVLVCCKKWSLPRILSRRGLICVPLKCFEHKFDK